MKRVILMKRYTILYTIILTCCSVTFLLSQASSQQENLQRINSPYTSQGVNQNNSLSLVGRWPNGSCKAVYVKDNYAYIGNGCVMTILDVSDPASPKMVGEIETPGIIRDIYVWRHYAYIATGRDGLRVIDVSDPSKPVEAGYMPMWFITSLTGARGVIYASNHTNVAIINITAPTGPEKENTINTYEKNWDISLLINSRTYLCIANSNAGLRIFDVTNIYDVVEVVTIETLGSVRDVFISGEYAYVAAYNKMYIIDLSDPSDPEIVGSFQTRYQFCNIFVSGGHAYVTDELHGGLWIIDVSNPANPVTKSYFHPGSGGSEGIFVKDQCAYVAHGSAGLQILDISSPGNPQKISYFETGGRLGSIVVLGDYAYTIGGTSLVIFDVSDPAHPEYHSSVLIDDSYIVDLNICGDYAYAVGYFGLGIIDISDPDNPAVVGVYQTKNPWSVFVKDRYAYMTTSDGFHVIDVSNKSDPRQVWYYEAEDHANKVNIQGNYAYLTESSSGLQIFDISKPDNPVIIGHLHITDLIMDEIFLSGTYAYVAAGHNGLRIIDVSVPENPKEVGYFDEGFRLAGDLHVSNNFAYVTDGVNGLRIIDVSLPENMELSTLFKTGDFAKDVFVSGNLIYLAGGDSGLYILKNELVDESEHIPPHISLIQNYPNPFNTSTHICFELSVPERVTLKLFDTRGRELDTLVNNVLYNMGSYEVNWNADHLPSGIYMCHFHAGDHVETKKMLLIR